MNYEFSVPSREQILSLLRKRKTAVSLSNIIKTFELSGPDALEGLNRRLTAMKKDGIIVQNKRGSWLLGDCTSFVIGTVIGHKDGFGFLSLDDGSQEDMFIPQHEMLQLMHGDKVMARASKSAKGGSEASVVEILQRANTHIVGRIVYEGTHYLLVPEDQRIKQDIYIAKNHLGGAKLGQVVEAVILEQPTKYTHPQGKVIEVLGEIDDPGMEIEIAVRKFKVPVTFSSSTQTLLQTMPDGVLPKELRSRIDLRDIPFVTIDGVDSRDFDDAVFATPCTHQGKKAWRLLVAIADVAHYVKPEEALDLDARERGTSVYFPRRVIPMLPEKLSNDLCSLNPQVDRLSMVCDMVVDQQANVVAYQFYEAVIHSHARTTYDQVWQVLQHQDPALALLWEEKGVREVIEHLYQLYQLLDKARQKRGAMDFDTVETQIICDELGKIQEIKPLVRNDAHKLIEECMLLANTCAADFIIRHKKEALFRVHEKPNEEKLSALRETLKPLGLNLPGGSTPTGKDYASLLQAASNRSDYAIIQTLCLRSMQQALYSPDNIGHYGLAYEAYTHFTSPIRRYPDLLVHRVIKSILKRRKYQPKLQELVRAKGETAKSYEHEVWKYLGEHCSWTERRADEASRDVLAWLKCWYMKEKEGEVFQGTISSVTNFGVFVTLERYYVEGMIHVTALGNDYFVLNESLNELRGQRSGIRFRLGDKIPVQISRVDLDNRRIELCLAKNTGFKSLMKPEKRKLSQAKNLKKAKAKTKKVQQAIDKRREAKRKRK